MFSPDRAPNAGSAVTASADRNARSCFQELRRRSRRLQRQYIVANGVPAAVSAWLAYDTEAQATRVYGQFNVGLIVGIAQGVLLIATTAVYDVRWTRFCDPLAEEVRALAPAHVAPRRASNRIWEP